CSSAADASNARPARLGGLRYNPPPARARPRRPGASPTSRSTSRARRRPSRALAVCPDAPETRSQVMPETQIPRPRAVLLGVQLPGVDDAEHASSLAELARLAKTLGFEVVGQVTQRRARLASGAVVGARAAAARTRTKKRPRPTPTRTPSPTTRSGSSGRPLPRPARGRAWCSSTTT